MEKIKTQETELTEIEVKISEMKIECLKMVDRFSYSNKELLNNAKELFSWLNLD